MTAPKYAALLVGITFAVFLMIEMTSLFAGILMRSFATVINIGASIWVMDPAIQTVANTIPLPDYVLDEVRSIPGVKYAVPLYSGAALLKLHDGTYQAANVIGLDDTSLFGGRRLLSGNIRTSSRERVHRRQGLGILQTGQPENRQSSSNSTTIGE
jgi:putative ABC transport system permease protein